MKTLTMMAAALLFAAQLYAQQFTIKFATLAPEGSTWINIMKEYDAAIRKESGGRLGFKIYAGGVAGDEKDVLRKIRMNQFQSAGITGVGMGEIAKEVRILDMPFLFKNHGEVDYVMNKFDGEFRQAFERNGYVLLGWAEVGFVYVFTNTPVYKVSDMKNVKMWAWEGDPVADAAFKAMGVNYIPLSITDVLQSVQTKMINGFYSVPLATVSLQWYTAVKYMLDYPLTNSAGSVVISKNMYDKMPKDLQDILLKNGRIYMRKLTEQSRKDNIKSLDVLKKNKIQFTKPDPKEAATYDEIGRTARRSLVGKMYTQDLLNRIEGAVNEARQKGVK
ncbi:MAG: TRAP transporter substrate-binding protein DctP [Acidobacteriota bacterium]